MPTRPLALCALALCAAASARADVLSIAATQSGNYAADGVGNINSPGFQNYFVGYSSPSAVAERRNFFIFDTAPLASATVLSAELILYVPKFAPPVTTDPGDGYISPDPSETYMLSGTMIPASELGDPTNDPTESSFIWGTLGTGLFFGAIEIFPTDKGTYLHIPLSAPAVAILDSGPATFAIGGRLVSLDHSRPMVLDELVFSFTDMPGSGTFIPPTLKLTVVPAPSAPIAFAAAGALLTARRRR